MKIRQQYCSSGGWYGLWSLAAFLLGAIFSPSASAQDFPSKPVRIIVPFSAGTATDIVARRLGERLAVLWDQGVVIENQAGAAGNIGAANGAKAAPDGYTLVMLGLPHAINASLYAYMAYDLQRDFLPVARIATTPMVIVANPKFAANSIAELIAMAKARPNEILYGTNGNGSVGHLAFELLKTRTGAKFTHVPYKAVGPIVMDLLSAQIPVAALAAASAIPLAASKSMKVLAITTSERSEMFPGVPTVAEAGIPGYNIAGWAGLVAPARTPAALVEKISADVKKVSQDKDFLEQVRQQAMKVDVLDSAAYQAFLSSEVDKWSALVKASDAKAE